MEPTVKQTISYGVAHLDVSVEIGNELLIFMTHTTSKVGDSNISLLAVSKITLRNQNMTHGKHSKTPNLLGCVENHWREPTRHLGIKTNLNTGLDLVLTLDQKVKKLLSMHCCFSKVCHQTCQTENTNH